MSRDHRHLAALGKSTNPVCEFPEKQDEELPRRLVRQATLSVELLADATDQHFRLKQHAALAWTESVTEVARTGVPDDVYEQARAEFSEAELLALTMAVIAINGWTRLAVSFRTKPGTYQPRGAGHAMAAVG